jgi:hypothetical protein
MLRHQKVVSVQCQTLQTFSVLNFNTTVRACLCSNFMWQHMLASVLQHVQQSLPIHSNMLMVYLLACADDGSS